MTLPLAQIVWRRVACWLVVNRLERVWKDAILFQLELVLGATEENTKKVRVAGHKAEIWTQFFRIQSISYSESSTMVD